MPSQIETRTLETRPISPGLGGARDRSHATTRRVPKVGNILRSITSSRSTFAYRRAREVVSAKSPLRSGARPPKKAVPGGKKASQPRQPHGRAEASRARRGVNDQQPTFTRARGLSARREKPLCCSCSARKASESLLT